MATWDNAIWVDPLVALTMATIVGGAVLRLSRPVRRVWQALGRMLEDWHGTEARPGVDKRAGVMERLAAIEENGRRRDERMTAIEAQLKPNGGSSLYDQVKRTADAVAPENGE